MYRSHRAAAPKIKSRHKIDSCEWSTRWFHLYSGIMLVSKFWWVGTEGMWTKSIEKASFVCCWSTNTPALRKDGYRRSAYSIFPLHDVARWLVTLISIVRILIVLRNKKTCAGIEEKGIREMVWYTICLRPLSRRLAYDEIKFYLDMDTNPACQKHFQSAKMFKSKKRY